MNSPENSCRKKSCFFLVVSCVYVWTNTVNSQVLCTHTQTHTMWFSSLLVLQSCFIRFQRNHKTLYVFWILNMSFVCWNDLQANANANLFSIYSSRPWDLPLPHWCVGPPFGIDASFNSQKTNDMNKSKIKTKSKTECNPHISPSETVGSRIGWKCEIWIYALVGNDAGFLFSLFHLTRAHFLVCTYFRKSEFVRSPRSRQPFLLDGNQWISPSCNESKKRKCDETKVH